MKNYDTQKWKITKDTSPSNKAVTEMTQMLEL